MSVLFCYNGLKNYHLIINELKCVDYFKRVTDHLKKEGYKMLTSGGEWTNAVGLWVPSAKYFEFCLKEYVQ